MMIRMPGADGQGAVDLLGGDDGGEFVRQGDPSEGDGEAGATERLGRPAIGRPDGYNELLDAVILHAAECGCKFFRTHLLAAAVGQNEVRCSAPRWTVEMGKKGGFGGEFTLFAGQITTRSLDVALQQLGVWFRGWRAPRPDGGEEEIHFLINVRVFGKHREIYNHNETRVEVIPKRSKLSTIS